MFKLTGLNRPYLAIEKFEPVDLPDFTLITGLNGSGKTHLLKAIDARVLTTDQQSTLLIPHDIAYYDAAMLEQRDIGVANPTTLSEWKNKLLEGLRHVLGTQFVTDQRYKAITSNIDPADRPRIEQDIEGTLNQLDPGIKAALRKIEKKMHKSLIDLTEDEVQQFGEWGSTELFQQRLASLFVAYRDAELKNEIDAVRFSKGASRKPPLSDDDFIATYGEAPWLSINRALLTSGLNVEFTPPNRYSLDGYEAELKQIGTNIKIRFNALSSGEKIILALTFCAFYADENRQTLVVPKILLLDEIDSHLHPSMTKWFFRVINDVFVGKLNIKVIATTHSPITVALAPDGSVFKMQKTEDKTELRLTTKRRAIDELTAGASELAVSFEGRRQVFVEGASDAPLYSKIFEILKGELGSERTLNFIGAGVKSKIAAEQNGGKIVVKNYVDSFIENGNDLIFGLLDWDCKNKPTRRIVILGMGERYALENALLDPLLLAALVVRNHSKLAIKLDFQNTLHWRNFHDAGMSEWQRIADVISGTIIPSPAKKLCCEYYGDFSIEHPIEYLQMNGHDLQDKVLNTFPELKRYQGSDGLMKEIVSGVITEFPSLLPNIFVRAFTSLLSSDP